ncbi:MAG: hydantoinase/oxoprolinase family protein, partial [Anaerolineae bacterium]|nr:hydantoinase/oxoprolinase family protein [Anaerolineae bacterium]
AFVAANVARELGIPRAIIPPGPGNFSAFGMLMVDVIHDYSQTSIIELADMDVSAVNAVYAQLAAQGHEALANDGFEPEQRTFLPTAEMRYRGQEHTVNVPMPGLEITPDQIPGVIEAFNKVHQQAYGHSMMEDPIEIVTLRLRAVGVLPNPDLPQLERGTGQLDAARKGTRDVYVRENRARVTYTVYDRMKLGAGDRIEGPAIIEEPSSTTMIHTGDVLTVGAYGELTIQIG